jgi:trimeric autotransporter adhesin
MQGRTRRAVLLALLLGSLMTFAVPGAASAAPGDATASLVANLDPLGSSNPANLFNANGTLFFSASDGDAGTELWKSNGGPLGPGGTEMVANINPGANSSNPNEFVRIGDTVFFAANDGCCAAGQHGTELWKTEPPYTTATMVEDINLDLDGAATADSFPQGLTNVNGTLLFQADGGDGAELWKLEGPNYDNAVEAADINALPGNGSFPQELTVANGILFFVADDNNGYELWKSVSPFNSASMVKNIDPGSTEVPAHLTDVNGTLLFAANDGVIGEELWKSVGPAYDSGSTSIVENINTTAGADSSPTNLTNVNGTLFFTATDAGGDDELRKSTAGYTSTTKIDVNTFGSSGTCCLTNVGGTLYFRASDGSNGFEPWKSNGGAVGAGTEPLGDLNPSGDSSPAGFTGVGSQLFFSANDGTNGAELWKSTGTGATMVANINVTPNPGASSSPQFLTDVNGTLFFRASDGLTGNELWKATVEPAPPPTTTPPAATPTVPATKKKKCKKKHGKKSAASAKKKHCKKKHKKSG